LELVVEKGIGDGSIIRLCVMNEVLITQHLPSFLPSFLPRSRFFNGRNSTNERLTYGNRTQDKVVHRVATYRIANQNVGGSGSGLS